LNNLIDKNLNDEIDLSEIFKKVCSSKYLIISITLVFSLASIFYSLSIKEIYTSKMIVEEVSSNDSYREPASFGGLSSLAGLSSNSSSKTRSQYAREVIYTKDFFDRLIEDSEFFVELVAAVDYDKKNKKLIYDNAIYDEEKNTINDEYLQTLFHEDVHVEFLNSIKIIDLDSGSLLISVSHYSPYVAKKWLDYIFVMLNEVVKEMKLTKAEKSYEFLQNELSMTKEVDLKKAISSLLIKELETITLSESSEYFVFSVVDSSRVPERKDYPNKRKIVIFWTLIGLFLSLAFVILRPVKRQD
jgi:LPS O-antigen subunit length determinant protein (WzzB/FepE family)